MPVTLDHDCFPHIVEAILFYADRKTLLDARLLSSSMRRVADSFFCGDGMSIVFSKAKTGSSSQESESFTRSVTSVGTSLEAITRGPPRLRVPCFGPGGDLEAQHRAIKRTSNLSLLCCAVTLQLNELLQHVQPTCHVHLSHTDEYATSNVALHIPPTSSLEIEISFLCCGVNAVFADDSSRPVPQVLKHSSSHVSVFILGDCEADTSIIWPTCCLVRQIITPLVRRLTVTGTICGLFSSFDGVDINRNPDLQVTLEHSDWCHKMGAAEVNDFRHKTAVLFKIPVHQVHYTQT